MKFIFYADQLDEEQQVLANVLCLQGHEVQLQPFDNRPRYPKNSMVIITIGEDEKNSIRMTDQELIQMIKNDDAYKRRQQEIAAQQQATQALIGAAPGLFR